MAPRPRLLVLDVDGVLVDPRGSFAQAVAGALEDLAPDLPWEPSHYAAFKAMAGFNNDFRVTAGALALAEAEGTDGYLERVLAAAETGFPHLEPRMAQLEPRCRVAVRRHYREAWRRERPLVRKEDLDRYPGPVALYTGRPPQELATAFRVLGFRLPAVADSEPRLRKPSPDGLLDLAERFGASRILYVGDARDDAAALAAARRRRPDLEWTFAAVGPRRGAIARPGDLQAADLLELLQTECVS